MRKITAALPTTLLLFLLCVCQIILSNLKDTVILTAHPDSAAVIPFIQVWGLFPAAIVSTWLFTTISRRFSRIAACYLFLGGYLIYLLAFAFLLFPYREVLQLDNVGRWLSHHLPLSLDLCVGMVQHWTLSLFYIMCDLWATAIIAVIFWGFTNAATSAAHAQKTYGIVQLGGSLSALVAGVVANMLVQDQYSAALPFGSTAWEQTLIKQTLFMTLLGIACLFLFRTIHGNKVNQESTSDMRPHLSLKESVTFVLRYRYLTCIAMLIIGYAIVSILSDLIWKSHLSIAYPDPNDLMRLMNNIMWVVGIVSLLVVVAIPWLIAKLGWTFLAIITPILLLATSISFFASVLYDDFLANTLFRGVVGSPLTLVVVFGAIQNGLAKAMKFSVFDVSKEMAFTSLDPEVAWKGKAAIDGIGYHCGRAGSALVAQGLIVACGGLTASAPFFGGIILIALTAWIAAARRAGKEYDRLTQPELAAVAVERKRVF